MVLDLLPVSFDGFLAFSADRRERLGQCLRTLLLDAEYTAISPD